MNTITEYDLLKTMVNTGAVVYKVTSLINQGEIVEISTQNRVLKKMYIIHPDDIESFLNNLKINNVLAISLDNWNKAEKEAFLSGHPDFINLSVYGPLQ